MRAFSASSGPQSRSCAGIFLSNAEGIINLSPCYFSAQPWGRLWPINQLSTEWENQERDTVRRKIATQEGYRSEFETQKMEEGGTAIF